MAMMSGALYDALTSAHVEPDLARKAAEEVADIRTEFVKIEGRFNVLDAKVDKLAWMAPETRDEVRDPWAGGDDDFKKIHEGLHLVSEAPDAPDCAHAARLRAVDAAFTTVG